MTICARFDGRQVRECTRGIACICLIEQMADLLAQIAYPRRGSDDDIGNLDDAATLIQSNVSLAQLEQFADARKVEDE